MIKLLQPELPREWELRPWLQKIDLSHWYSNSGPLVRELEARLSMMGHPALTVSSGTAGLEIALAALRLKRGAIVIVPAFTYPASVTAIVRAGLVPHFVDVDRHSWSIDDKTIRPALLGANAILAVCPLGRHVDEINAGTKPVVFDAAAAYLNHDSALHLSVYSMHATKALGCGEGGFVTGPKLLLERCRALASFGNTSAPMLVEYESGTNAKLSEYHAAVALAMLDKLPSQIQYRQVLAEHYRDCVKEVIPGAQFQKRDATDVRSTWEFLLPAPVADKALEAMRERDIECRRWYYPACDRHPAFGKFPSEPLPNTRYIGERLLGLPFGMHVTLKQAGEIVSTLARWMRENGVLKLHERATA